MPIEFEGKPADSVQRIRAWGKLTKADYDKFIPEAESRIAQHNNKMHVLVDFTDFEGWAEISAMWADAKFGIKHHNDLERMAVIGHSKWQKVVCDMFIPVLGKKMRYFEEDQADQAREWVSIQEPVKA